MAMRVSRSARPPAVLLLLPLLLRGQARVQAVCRQGVSYVRRVHVDAMQAVGHRMYCHGIGTLRAGGGGGGGGY